MKSLSAFGPTFVATAALVASAFAEPIPIKASRQLAQRSTAASAANRSDAYNLYRPGYHFQSKSNWINDPCAPFFDPTTSIYHLFFQWNPYLNDWGNDTVFIAWGHATSYNLIDWDFDEEPALYPSQPSDIRGVFTGGFIPSTLPSANSTAAESSSTPLVLAYTSVKRSGVTFKEPYPIGSETLSLAESYDQGATWQKYDGNPIIDGAPTPNYTGWRDPYISYWPAVDRLMGTAENASMYALLSGGFRDYGPTTFVYKIDPHNLTSWEYVSPLVDIKSNSLAGKWTGDVGKNWECVNRMSLKDPNSELEREFLLISAEGTIPAPVDGDETASVKPMMTRNPRHEIWMTGDLAKTAEGGITFNPSASGTFDHGNLYAVNSFRHPVTGKLLSWGWVQEEDLPFKTKQEQGWTGVISLPRELYLQVHHNVKGYLGGKDLASVPLFEPLDDAAKKSTYGTMGVKLPHDVLKGLQARATSQERIVEWKPQDSFSVSSNRYQQEIALTDTAHVIMQTSIRYPSAKSTATVGLTIVHDKGQNLYTEISFNPVNQTIIIDRSHTLSSTASNLEKTINRRPESAPHTLLTYAGAGRERMETLDLVVLFDKSVLEVYVNERTIITSRVYVNSSSSAGSVRMFAEGKGATGVVFENTGVWSGVDAEMRY